MRSSFSATSKPACGPHVYEEWSAATRTLPSSGISKRTMSSKRRAPFIPPNGSSTSKQCPTVTLKMRRGSKKMLRGTPLIRTRATRDTHTHLIACPVVASRISHLAPRMRHDHMTAHRSACRRPKVAAPWAAPLRRAQSRRTPSTPKLGRRVAAYAQGPRRAGE